MTTHPSASASASPPTRWDQPAVFLRLTQRRKAKLEAVARKLGPHASPFQAIEACIDMALAQTNAASGAVAERLADLHDAIDQLTMERRLASDLLQDCIAESTRNSKAVLDLISAATANAAAQSMEYEDPVGLGAWLDAQLAAKGLSAKSSAGATAHWVGATMDTAALATMRFEVALTAVDGVAWTARYPEASLAHVGLVEVAGALFAAIPAMATGTLQINFERRQNKPWTAQLKIATASKHHAAATLQLI